LEFAVPDPQWVSLKNRMPPKIEFMATFIRKQSTSLRQCIFVRMKLAINGYGSKLGTPKLWMVNKVNTQPDIHICGPTSVFHFDHPNRGGFIGSSPTARRRIAPGLGGVAVPDRGGAELSAAGRPGIDNAKNLLFGNGWISTLYI